MDVNIVFDLLLILDMHSFPHGYFPIKERHAPLPLTLRNHARPVARRVSLSQLQVHFSIILPSEGAFCRIYFLLKIDLAGEEPNGILRLIADGADIDLSLLDFNFLLIGHIAIKFIECFLHSHKQVQIVGRLRLVNHRGDRWRELHSCFFFVVFGLQKPVQDVVLLSFDIFLNGVHDDFSVDLGARVVLVHEVVCTGGEITLEQDLQAFRAKLVLF